jgi:hypothetical protein
MGTAYKLKFPRSKYGKGWMKLLPILIPCSTAKPHPPSFISWLPIDIPNPHSCTLRAVTSAAKRTTAASAAPARSPSPSPAASTASTASSTGFSVCSTPLPRYRMRHDVSTIRQLYQECTVAPYRRLSTGELDMRYSRHWRADRDEIKFYSPHAEIIRGTRRIADVNSERRVVRNRGNMTERSLHIPCLLVELERHRRCHTTPSLRKSMKAALMTAGDLCG